MAEKGFGVKEVNLIGASGTPTIESPNNLNLNAVNVAISTNVSIGGTLSVTGNVSVGGTLTYEDVTNIDSVGMITARDHVVVGGGLSVVGVSTFNNIVNIEGMDLQTNGTLDIIGSNSSSGLDIQSNSSVQIGQNGFPNNDYATFTNTGVDLKYSGSSKLTTTNTGVNVTGAITVNGSALSITPTTSDIQVVYEITNQTSFSYFRFAGNGVDSSANNPDIYLERGQKYRFINNSGGSHPFQIQTTGGSPYTTGVTYPSGNSASSGNIDFAVRWDAPAQLKYQCTSHGSMVGNIYLRGGGGNETNVGVITSTNGILVHRTTNAGPLSGTGNYDFTLPSNCYKVDFVGHNISTSGSGTPAFRLGTSAGILQSGHYFYTKSGTGDAYRGSRDQIDPFDTNLNAGSDTGEIFMTFSSSSASNMWIFHGMANRRTQSGNMFVMGVPNLSGNDLTTIRFYPHGTGFDAGRFSWTAYCTS